MAFGFFDGDTPRSPEEIEKKRAIYARMMAGIPAPKDIGSGIYAMLTGIGAGIGERGLDKAEAAGRVQAKSLWDSFPAGGGQISGGSGQETLTGGAGGNMPDDGKPAPIAGQAVYDGFIARGWAPHQAAAMAGNIQQESGFNAGAINRGEGAHGLMQHRLDRFQNLQNFAAQRGTGWKDPNTQMDFIDHEMRNGSERKAGSAFFNSQSIEEANAAARGYIRYGDNSQAARLHYGRRFLRGSQPPAIAGGTSSDQLTGGAGDDMLGAALQGQPMEMMKRNPPATGQMPPPGTFGPASAPEDEAQALQQHLMQQEQDARISAGAMQQVQQIGKSSRPMIGGAMGDPRDLTAEPDVNPQLLHSVDVNPVKPGSLAYNAANHIKPPPEAPPQQQTYGSQMEQMKPPAASPFAPNAGWQEAPLMPMQQPSATPPMAAPMPQERPQMAAQSQRAPVAMQQRGTQGIPDGPNERDTLMLLRTAQTDDERQFLQQRLALLQGRTADPQLKQSIFSNLMGALGGRQQGMPQRGGGVQAPPQAQAMARQAQSQQPTQFPDQDSWARAVISSPFAPQEMKQYAMHLLRKDPLEQQYKQAQIAKLRREASGRDATASGKTGTDDYGNVPYGSMAPKNQRVTPAPMGQSVQGQTQQGAAAAIPPPGTNRKEYAAADSKRAAEDAMPADPKVATGLRGEVQGLPSYKNIAQAAPIYNSMVEAAGRNTKASDLHLVYGLGKIMDPASVMREGDMVMIKNTSSLPDWVKGTIASVSGGAALTPETRQRIMEEAHGRMQSYKQFYDAETKHYRGIAERSKVNPEDVIFDFGEFGLWKPAASQQGTPQATPQPSQQPDAQGWISAPNGVKIRPKQP